MQLTKRELFTLAALIGLLADPEDITHDPCRFKTCVDATADLAVRHAEATLKRLKKKS